MVTLYTFRRENITLADAVAAVADDTPAIVYTPRWCGFAVVRGGKLVDANGREPGAVYEVRAFTIERELRWRNDPRTGQGTAVIVTEKDESPPWQEPVGRIVADTDTHPATYLLWGLGTGRAMSGAWSELAEARIGGMPVPLAGVGSKGRAKLHAVEYIATDDCGSAYVCDERLTSITHSGEVERG